jgi:hypothetical protein
MKYLFSASLSFVFLFPVLTFSKKSRESLFGKKEVLGILTPILAG